MTDERIETVNAPLRAVRRDAQDKLYYVCEYVHTGQGSGWRHVTERGYVHSTSCYAQLGRMVSRENQQALEQLTGE